MSKRKLKVGDRVEFVSGNYSGLTGIIVNVDYNSSNANAIYGYYHSVELSNGEIGHIEKSEHWLFLQ